MIRRVVSWSVFGLALAAIPASAGECDKGAAARTITVDAVTPLVPAPTFVCSGAKVTIDVVNKPPLDPVKFTMDRAAATPPDNPLATLLNQLQTTGVPGVLGAMKIAKEAAEKQITAQAATNSQLETRLKRLEDRVAEVQGNLEERRKSFEELSKAAGNLDGCSGDKPDLDKCKTSAGALADKFNDVLSRGIPTFEDERIALREIDRMMVEGGASTGVRARRDEVAGAIEAQQFAFDKIKKVQGDLDATAVQLRKASANAKTTASYAVPPDRSTDTTVHVIFGSDDDKVEVPVVVHFQNWAWATMSAGVVITSFKRDNFVVNQHYDPKMTDPKAQTFATIQQQITTRQVIPMAFVNLQAPWLTWRCGSYVIGPTASIGVGVNVSTQSAEFAVGPGLHIGKVQLVVGAHWARSDSLINGFTVGQTVDAGLKPPVNSPYTAHWGVGVTYRK